MPVHVANARGGLARFLGELRYLPNQLTAARLVLVVVLWGFALAGNAVVVGVGLGLAFLTDVADGYAARRLNRTSRSAASSTRSWTAWSGRPRSPGS